MSESQNKINYAFAQDNGKVLSEPLQKLDTARVDPSLITCVGNGHDSGYTMESSESSYVKELQRSIRNVTKKITSIQKVEILVDNNPSLSLDELVATKKINNDQKAQVLKKPLLQQSLRQLEEQLVHYKQFEEDYRQQIVRERERLQTLYETQIEELRVSFREDAVKECRSETRRQLLVLSQFLRAAASRRALDADNQEPSEDSKAFEGVLLLLYGGDTLAVDTAERLITGSMDHVISTEGERLEITYERIRKLTLSDLMPTTEASLGDHVIPSVSSNSKLEAPINRAHTDPTLAHAGLTEPTEYHTNINGLEGVNSSAVPAQAIIDPSSANITASRRWEESTAQIIDSMTDSWVAVSRDPIEMEINPNANAINTTQNWAEDSAELPESISHGPVANDGFHEVHHGRESRNRETHQFERGGARARGRVSFRGDRSRVRGNRARGREAP